MSGVVLGFGVGVGLPLLGLGVTLWALLRRPVESKPRAAIVICQFGQLTPHPQVCVSLQSRGGAQTVYSFDDPDPDQRNAKATYYAGGLAHITGFPVVDEREAT